MRELDIPAGVFEDPDAVEFVRMWVAGGSDHVTLNIGVMGDREVAQWGMILADISVHIIRGLVQNGSTESADALRSQLEQAYSERLKYREDVDYTGSLGGTKQ